MGDEQGRKVEGENTAISSSFTADYDVARSTRIPGIISVSKPAFQGNEMNVPDKIVLNGDVDSETQGNLNIGLQKVSANLDSCMGGMVTPPRTLTVDDTTSRYTERKVDERDSRRKDFDRLSQKLIENSGKSGDDTDLKLQGEVVRLNKRVESLENQMSERQSTSFWKTTFVCLLTIINPIIVHWLFYNRRR